MVRTTIPPAQTSLIPSAIAPRRAPNTRGKRPARYPELNYEQLGAQLKISPVHLGRIMNGVCRPSMDLAVRLGALMGWSIDQVNQLYSGTNRNKNHNKAKETKGKSDASSRNRTSGRK